MILKVNLKEKKTASLEIEGGGDNWLSKKSFASNDNMSFEILRNV